MSKQYKIYGDIVQEYYIIVEAENHDEAWYASIAAPKKDWKKITDRNKGNKIDPYNVVDLSDNLDI